uniref:Putative salivary lipocalin n=1 Tax=Ixodes ricinus TaxID=34613 RepID=A0A0K8RJG7_IXORI
MTNETYFTTEDLPSFGTTFTIVFCDSKCMIHYILKTSVCKRGAVAGLQKLPQPPNFLQKDSRTTEENRRNSKHSNDCPIEDAAPVTEKCGTREGRQFA